MTTYGQPVTDEERHGGARPRASAAGLGSVDGRRPGQALWDLIEAEVRERWQDRAWYRHRRDIAGYSSRTFDDALSHVRHWQALIDENDRELRTLLRVLRRARRR